MMEGGLLGYHANELATVHGSDGGVDSECVNNDDA